MVIRTLERNFTVVEVLRKTAYGASSVCRDMEDGRLYVLNRFPDTGDGLRGLPLLVEAQKKLAFQDCIQVFTQDGEVWSQFAHGDGVSLKDYLAQRPLALLERLDIGANLLKTLVIQDMPTQIAAPILNSHHILVDESSSVSLRYVIDTQDLLEPTSMVAVCETLDRVFRLLFAPELEAKSAPELEGFIKSLHHGRFDTYLQIYAAYAPIHEELKRKTEEGDVEPQTFLFKLWKRIKAFFKLIKPFLIGLVIIVSFCYLVYTLLTPSTVTGTPVLFDSIGTVEIQPQNVLELS